MPSDSLLFKRDNQLFYEYSLFAIENRMISIIKVDEDNNDNLLLFSRLNLEKYIFNRMRIIEIRPEKISMFNGRIEQTSESKKERKKAFPPYELSKQRIIYHSSVKICKKIIKKKNKTKSIRIIVEEICVDLI